MHELTCEWEENRRKEEENEEKESNAFYRIFNEKLPLYNSKRMIFFFRNTTLV